MPVEREAKFQKKVIDFLRQHNVYVYKNAQNIYTEKGRPDLTACIPVKISALRQVFGDDAEVGLFAGVELKRRGHLREVSDAQQIVGRQIKRAAGIWLLVDDITAIEELLSALTGDEQ